MGHWYSHPMRNSKLLLKYVCPTFNFAMFLLRLQQKILHNVATLEERAKHVWIQQFSSFAKVQCLVVWFDRSIQGCRDHVPCGSAVDVTFSSHCVGSPHFPLLEQRHSLYAELPDYVTATQDVVVASKEEKVKWWCPQVERLSCWSAAVRQVLLVQPSSAAAERAFSSLLVAFRDQQDSALADYLHASKILQYNERWCWLVYTILINVFSSNYWCWKNSELSRQVDLLCGLIISTL